jgi:hypothetical protein
MVGLGTVGNVGLTGRDISGEPTSPTGAATPKVTRQPVRAEMMWKSFIADVSGLVRVEVDECATAKAAVQRRGVEGECEDVSQEEVQDKGKK